MKSMQNRFLSIAVALALVAGLAVGLTACGGDNEAGDSAAVTRSDEADETTDAEQRTVGDETGDESDDAAATGEDGTGTELAPESASDARPDAPDDVVGDRPGAGGEHDPGQ